MDPNILAELRTLQSQHSLAAHMWEGERRTGDHTGHRVPHGDVLQHLISHEEAKAKLKKGEKCDELSMSLLADEGARTTTSLYFVGMGGISHFGYLFDVNQTRPDRAFVTEVNDEDAYSALSPARKAPAEGTKRKALGVSGFLEPDNERLSERFYSFIGSDEGREHTGKQLNKLGKLLHKRKRGELGDSVADNEIMVVAGQEHLKAILVPSYPNAERLSDVRVAVYETLVRLQGALAGLVHLREGIDLPVVIYHVAGTDAGKLTEVGKGKEELERVARDAITQLQAFPQEYVQRILSQEEYILPPQHYTHNVVREVLGVEMHQPIEKQDWKMRVQGSQTGDRSFPSH